MRQVLLALVGCVCVNSIDIGALDNIHIPCEFLILIHLSFIFRADTIFDLVIISAFGIALVINGNIDV